jgi:hypothetical protein
VGFYSLPAKNVNKNETKGLSVELLTKLGCRACPLDRVKGNKNPHLAPQGHDDPLIYMLDGPPTTRDDAAGKNFAGGVDRIIKHMLPRWVGDRVRWSSITRTASREIDGIPQGRRGQPQRVCSPATADDDRACLLQAVGRGGHREIEA